VAAEWSVTGKVVLITGAARGIGAEVAQRLAGRGARLALLGLEGEQLRQTATSCGSEAQAWEVDVTDAAALEKAVAEVVDRFGGIDVVIANAGIAPTGFVRSMDPAAFDRTIEVNLLGVWRTVRACLQHVIDRRGYCLVMSSLAAIEHAPGMSAYCASKAGCEAFADCLRTEVKHLGVDVGVGYFSWIATDMVAGADQHPVFGKMRAKLPGPAGRTYPVSAVGEAVVTAITRRARAVHVPGWVGAVKAMRGWLPRLVEAVSTRTVAETDREAAEDVQRRGAESSRPVGPGGRAALREDG
jgi:NAD(P)-dependent dehydrogenase (short-subunit alcohol dehydrogenase family)